MYPMYSWSSAARWPVALLARASFSGRVSNVACRLPPGMSGRTGSRPLSGQHSTVIGNSILSDVTRQRPLYEEQAL